MITSTNKTLSALRTALEAGYGPAINVEGDRLYAVLHALHQQGFDVTKRVQTPPPVQSIEQREEV